MECDAKSPIAEVGRCRTADIRKYPTWIIGGNRYEGVMSLEDLARASAFQPPQPR